MTSDALAVVECLFNTIWALFTSWCIPGTDVTPASFFLFLISASIGLRYVLSFLHSPNAGAGSAVESARRANTFAKGYEAEKSRRPIGFGR